jgi:hypothetical protein
MSPALPRIALLAAALAAAALSPSARAGEPGEEPPPEHPLFSSGTEDWMELRGAFEPGYRVVRDREGRYDQDVNLRGGLRLLSAHLEGSALQEGLWADRFAFDLSGIGDPIQHVGFEVRADDRYDLRIHSDRDAYVFRSAGDPHPFDTLRDSDGVRLSVRASKGLELRFTSERLRREGDANLDHWFPSYLSFPVAATVDYEGLTQSAGLDGSSGALRYGASWTWGVAEDDSMRLLDRPDTPVRDLGTYRNRSDVRTGTATGRLGLRLWKGKVDLSVLGSWHAGETDTRVFGTEQWSSSPTTPAFRRTRGVTESNSRGWTGRAEALLLLHPDWEVLARRESTSRAQDGDGVLWIRPAAASPPIPQPFFASADADLDRTGVEARWRASKEWRFRAGAEEVRERVVERDLYVDSWSPTTAAATAGADWSPSERFDASLLVREARARDPATEVSADEGRWVSFRLRARRPDGFHGTLFARLKQRTNGDADAVVSYDSYGYAFGHASPTGWMEFSITRQDTTFAADTRFASDASAPVVTAHRVRFDEDVLAANLDFSEKLLGPLRLFGAARWADGGGGVPYVQSDVSLGLGWRFVKEAELRIEGRRVAYIETNRNVDDYAARIATLSILYEF